LTFAHRATEVFPLFECGDRAKGNLACHALAVCQELIAKAVAVKCAVALADNARLIDGIVQELGEVCFFHDSLSFSFAVTAMLQCSYCNPKLNESTTILKIFLSIFPKSQLPTLQTRPCGKIA